MNIIMSRAIQHQYPHRFSPPVTPTSPLDFTEQIPFRELELSRETLGSGSFGTVYKGRWRGRKVAVKQFKTREEIDSFLVEVKQLSSVKHANIVHLYGASTFADGAYLIMEYAEGGSLNHLLHECKQQQYDLRHACSWAMQTARGVAYLHEIRPKPIMHRDLKPANLLLFSRGKILKICDFGTACTVKTQMTNNTGSASYMAPEVFATSSYLESGDVFSWSIIFWEILARRHPYSQQYSNPYQILWSVKQEGTRPTELESCPEIIWKLITSSWNKDPKKRPSMREVAEEMEFIFSLTEKSNNSIANDQSRSTSSSSCSSLPLRQNYPINPVVANLPHQQQPPRHALAVCLESRYQDPSLSEQFQFTFDKGRELYYHKRALAHSLKYLKSKAEELEAQPRCDKEAASWLLVEESRVLTEELRRRELEKEKLEKQSSTFSYRYPEC